MVFLLVEIISSRALLLRGFLASQEEMSSEESGLMFGKDCSMGDW